VAPVNRSVLDQLLAAVREAFDRNDRARAVAVLAAAESRVFLDGDQAAAAELAFARLELERGNTAGAVDVVRRAAARSRP
jgi:hypothetical protein